MKLNYFHTLANFIENSNRRFNMESGTSCISYFASLMEHNLELGIRNNYIYHEFRDSIYTPQDEFPNFSYDKCTKEVAINFLRNILNNKPKRKEIKKAWKKAGAFD